VQGVIPDIVLRGCDGVLGRVIGPKRRYSCFELLLVPVDGLDRREAFRHEEAGPFDLVGRQCERRLLLRLLRFGLLQRMLGLQSDFLIRFELRPQVARVHDREVGPL